MARLVVLRLIVIIGILSLTNKTYAIADTLKVGDRCPDFVLREVRYFSKSVVTLNDFKGKWLILDFWGKTCSACIASMPKINAFQKKYGDRNVQFLLVGELDRENQIRKLFSNLRQRMSLELPCAFDTLLRRKFEIIGAPYLIIIDPDGMVRGITYSIRDNDMEDLLSGKQPHLPKMILLGDQFIYDEKTPFLLKGNGGNESDFLFRSLLSKWTELSPSGFPYMIEPTEDEKKLNRDQGRFEALKVDPCLLYMFAYTGQSGVNDEDSLYGELWPKPVLEVRDTTKIMGDWRLNNNLYCYSLMVPDFKATKQYLMAFMQADLKNYFGYNAQIEIRRMPYWKLIATDGAKVSLKTKGDSHNMNGSWDGGSFANLSMAKFMKMIRYKSGLKEPIIDATNISDNIDINLHYAPFNFESVRNALRENGLDLISAEKEITVLVIKDSK